VQTFKLVIHHTLQRLVKDVARR